ncbi:phospholipase D-like domain-containing protein [Oricola cellulosilytica]|uniref:Phospholipase D n=1 Tax=Oricola cellulosilytica TaxID=1429082 RepID=A0A4R0PCA5_9HYPH|nr:phospholipase D family protein [Oricola cellulosilytica]TCD15091.1 hypothetical protein E0D97_05960 [Oricola cellulosilytica]
MTKVFEEQRAAKTAPPESPDLKFLLTAAQAFPKMEELILSATNSLDLSFHFFAPDTRVRSKKAKASGFSDWGDLLVDAVARGVRVRLLINDFDPVGAPDEHAQTWRRMNDILQRRDRLPQQARDNFQVVAGFPGGQSGSIIRTLIWPWVRQTAADLVAKAKGDLPPGLRAILDRRGNLRFWPPASNFTQAYHQKFMIADGDRAIIGGLDVDERRFDTPDHQRPAEQTWHDVDMQISGPPVADLSVHFEDSWRTVLTRGFSFGDRPNFPAATAGPPPERVRTGERVRFVSTRAYRTANPFAFGPRTNYAGIERAHLDIIGSARSLIYIETQFLRSKPIRNALVAAAAHPSLHLIVLLPGAPDIVAFTGDRSAVHRYGEWLQLRALNRLRLVYGNRFSAFCLTNGKPREERHERDAINGKAMVYVHSKVLVADDRTAIVSSANLNGRSMRWDFEAGYVLEWPERAAELRQKLWRQHLGEDLALEDAAHNPAAAMAAWQNCAAQRSSDAGQCAGGVVPFPHKKTERFSKRHAFIPSNMV